MTILEQIKEQYSDEEFLIADGFDEAIIGVDKDFIICYDQDKCIEILSKDMNWEEAEEYFWYNTVGSYVGKKTPRFIKIFKKDPRGDEWRIQEYNRNRSQEDQVKTIEELNAKLEMDPDLIR
jgi:ubiquinone/menaquinone biosynthesis C-methylase UbiE